MFEAHIINQHLTLLHPCPVADSLNYLSFRFRFSPDWDGLDKWAHFGKDGEVYDIPLTDDTIRPEDGLNLTEGTWNLYLHGDCYDAGTVVRRITTDQASFTVKPTGTLAGQPFGEIAPSVAEQILARLTEIENNPDPAGETVPGIVSLSQIRAEAAKNHYTKSETDGKLAEKAASLRVSKMTDDTVDYTAEEIIAHVRNGGHVTYYDYDDGEFAYLGSFMGFVFFGITLPMGGNPVNIVYMISGNTVTKVSTELAPMSVLEGFAQNVYTKYEIDAIMGSYVTDIADLIGGEAHDS